MREKWNYFNFHEEMPNSIATFVQQFCIPVRKITIPYDFISKKKKQVIINSPSFTCLQI